MIEFKTSGNLDIKTTVLDIPFDEQSNWKRVDVGTCTAFFGETECDFDIFGLANSDKGNGNLNDTLEYFEYICAKKNKDLFLTHIENERFKKHLINKRGFKAHGNVSVVKRLKK